MSDNPDVKQPESTPAGAQNTENMIPQSRFNEINSAYRELQAQVEQMRAEAQQRKDAELADQEKWKELAEQRQAELERYKSYEQQAKRLQESLIATNQARIEQIPEDKRHLVPEYDDPTKVSQWLDKALPDLVANQRPSAPKLDGGAGSSLGGNTGAVRLSQEQMAFADAAGISYDAYAKALSQRGKPIELSKKDE